VTLLDASACTDQPHQLQKHEADTAKAHEQVAILQEQVDQHKATALKVGGWRCAVRDGANA
jgi:hypothetical protein